MGTLIKKKNFKYCLEQKLFQWSDVLITPSINTSMINLQKNTK